MTPDFSELYTKHYASKFSGKDCPLSRQVKRSSMELQKNSRFNSDPVGDKEARIEPGILQKYKGRILVLAANDCALHCRFCFRRNMEYPSQKKLPERLSALLAKREDIYEVIFSGGDPLVNSNSELAKFFDAVPKRMRIRIHSRMPIANPKRFNGELWSLFENLGKRLVFVIHTNHPKELDDKSEMIFNRLVEIGATVISQTVLLKGVNDNANILAELSEKLFSQKVLPYYLHKLDRAQGAAHFEVSSEQGKRIFNELKTLLPGYLVPRFVYETKGKKSKTWIKA